MNQSSTFSLILPNFESHVNSQEAVQRKISSLIKYLGSKEFSSSRFHSKFKKTEIRLNSTLTLSPILCNFSLIQVYQCLKIHLHYDSKTQFYFIATVENSQLEAWSFECLYYFSVNGVKNHNLDF